MLSKFHWTTREWRDTRKPREGNEGGREGGQKKTETRKRSRFNDSRGRDLVGLQVQPCCKGKISCRFVQRGYGGSVPRRFLANALCIQETRRSCPVATRWKKRRSNERPSKRLNVARKSRGTMKYNWQRAIRGREMSRRLENIHPRPVSSCKFKSSL